MIWVLIRAKYPSFGRAEHQKTFKYAVFFQSNMVIIQAKSKKSPAGGRYKASEKKRKYQTGGLPTNTLLSDKNTVRQSKLKGGVIKNRLFYASTVNILNKKTKKYAAVKIKAVVENAANRHFVRRNIITKGTILETEKGRAIVTSRPGQDGMLNAVLIE